MHIGITFQAGYMIPGFYCVCNSIAAVQCDHKASRTMGLFCVVRRFVVSWYKCSIKALKGLISANKRIDKRDKMPGISCCRL